MAVVVVVAAAAEEEVVVAAEAALAVDSPVNHKGHLLRQSQLPRQTQ